MRILLCGLGGIGQRHARNLRALRGDAVELFAWRVRGHTTTVTDRLEVEPDVDVEQRYGVQRVATLEEGLSARPDAVIVANPSSLHIATATAALGAGVPVFVEKPLAHEREGVAAMLETQRRTGVTGLVGYQLRWHPLVRALIARLDADAIGRVLAVRAVVGEYLPWFHKYEDYRTMYAARRALGGGVVLSQIHEFDYLLRAIGMPDRLTASGGQLSSLELDVEDVAATTLEVPRDGIRVPVQLLQDFVQRPPSRNCEVIGDKGRLTLDLTVPMLTQWDGEGAIVHREVIEPFVRNQLFLDEMAHFLDCVEGRAKPEVSLEDGARSVAIALGVHEAIAQRAWVPLAPICHQLGVTA